MHFLCSDSARWTKLVAALLLLCGLGAYAAASSHWQCTSFHDCLDHPDLCDDRTLVTGVTRITTVEQGGFSVWAAAGCLRFSGDFPGLAPGRYADIEAVFHAPDRFEVLAVHVHLERMVKIWGSLAAAMIVAALVFRVWRRGGF